MFPVSWGRCERRVVLGNASRIGCINNLQLNWIPEKVRSIDNKGKRLSEWNPPKSLVFYQQPIDKKNGIKTSLFTQPQTELPLIPLPFSYASRSRHSEGLSRAETRFRSLQSKETHQHNSLAGLQSIPLVLSADDQIVPAEPHPVDEDGRGHEYNCKGFRNRRRRGLL